MRIEDDKEIIPTLEHCESKKLSYWLGAVYAFKGLLLVFGVFLAWETRGVAIPALNDSRYIGTAYEVFPCSLLCLLSLHGPQYYACLHDVYICP